MGGKRVPRRSHRMMLVPSRALSRALMVSKGGPLGRRATGDRGARACACCRAAQGGRCEDRLRQEIGIVTDNDSCPTLCCLVLTDAAGQKGNGYGHCGQQIPTALDYISCHQTHVIPPPPPPFRFSVLGGGGHNNTLVPLGVHQRPRTVYDTG